MRHTPRLLMVVGRKEAIMNGMSDLNDGTGDALAEPGLVADFGKEGGGADEDDLGA